MSDAIQAKLKTRKVYDATKATVEALTKLDEALQFPLDLTDGEVVHKLLHEAFDAAHEAHEAATVIDTEAFARLSADETERMATWGELRHGDWIVCPASKRREQVILTRSSGVGKVLVRTVEHDHIREAMGEVERG